MTGTYTADVLLTDGSTVAVEIEGDADDELFLVARATDGSVVGRATCRRGDGSRPSPAWVEVDIGWRRRGLGAGLLRLLLDQVAATGVVQVRAAGVANDPAIRRLGRSAGAICARRVESGRTTVVLVVRRAGAEAA